MNERLRSAETPPEADAEARILFVVDAEAGAVAGAAAAGRYGADIAVCNLAGVNREILDQFAPHFVVSPIFAASFDMMDVARRLSQLGFRGGYRAVVSRPLPDPGLVLSEVRAACPCLDVDILPATQLMPQGGRSG